jgi:hypothetical protein
MGGVVGTRIARFLGKNVLAVIAIFLALSGTAYAGFIVNSNSDIAPDTVSGHNPPSGDHSNLIDASVTTQDLASSGVTTGKLANGAVTSLKIANGAVVGFKVSDDAITTSKLADGAVTTSKLADGSVTHAKLSANSVTGGNVSNNSLTLSDLKGIDESGTIDFNLTAGGCGKLSLIVSGATAGQAAMLTWTGSVPTHVVLGPLKVVSATSIITYACNLGSTHISLSNIGVRVVTFG